MVMGGAAGARRTALRGNGSSPEVAATRDDLPFGPVPCAWFGPPNFSAGIRDLRLLMC